MWGMGIWVIWLYFFYIIMLGCGWVRIWLWKFINILNYNLHEIYRYFGWVHRPSYQRLGLLTLYLHHSLQYYLATIMDIPRITQYKLRIGNLHPRYNINNRKLFSMPSIRNLNRFQNKLQHPNIPINPNGNPFIRIHNITPNVTITGRTYNWMFRYSICIFDRFCYVWDWY